MSIKDLQTKIGVKADGVFGPNTLRAAVAHFKLSPERGAHFFGQTSHETGGFKVFSENLNYSASGLRKIFPKYFPNQVIAEQYAGRPFAIANKVYGNRMGNGDEASGDGWKFRGRGALQLTGKDNYKMFSDFMKEPEILSTPDLVATKYAFDSAMFFFTRNNLWKLCDAGVTDNAIELVTRRVNGGTHGLEDRKNKTYDYYKILKG